MLALKRWTGIAIEFNGIFYQGDNYTKRHFHIIDGWKLDEKSGELVIWLNQQYIKQIKESNYYKLINFDDYRKLSSPVSARLYEILVKIKLIKNKQKWKINVLKLAEKLTVNRKYPSGILSKITSAVNEINQKTELEVKSEYNKKTQVCSFFVVKS